MKRIIFVFFLFIPFVVFSQSNTNQMKYIPQYGTILSSDKGEKIMNQCSRSIPENIDKYFDLTKENIELLESNFRKVLAIKSTIRYPFVGWKVDKLENYGFQYLGIVISNRKYIYLNAFIIDSEDDFTNWYKNWKVDPIVICDGGDGYWGALFDLETGSFSQLSINGI